MLVSETLGERNTHISDMRHIKSVAQSRYSNRVLAEIRVYPEIYLDQLPISNGVTGLNRIFG